MRAAGVDEYIVYDPDSDYLDPPLKGFRLADGEYRPMRPTQGGALESETLGLRLSIGAGGRLSLHDAATGERLERPAEVAAARREAEARAATEQRRAERFAALLAAHGIDPEAADS